MLYEGIREAQQEDTLIQEYVDYPRPAIQITGGAQHNEALGYAARFKQDTPTKRVYYRYSDDDNIQERETPDACAARLASYAALGLIPSYNNEPRNTQLTEVVTHAIQTMRLLKARRVENVLMVNWNAGFIDNLEVQWQPVLNDLYAGIRQLGYTAGFHDYMNTRFLDDPKLPLYVGRYRHVLKRFPGLKVCISEFGFDSHAPNPTIDGYKNHTQIWSILFPGKSPQDVYLQEAKKADAAIYAPDGVEDVLWFCRGHNLTGRWVSFNFQHDTELIDKKKVYRRSVVTQIDYGTRQPSGKVKLLRNASRVNLRESPVNGAVIKVLTGGEIAAFWDRVGANGWRKLEIDGKVGYASADFVTFDVVTEPIPQPPTLPEFPSSLQEMKNWRNVFKSLETDMTMAVQFIDEWIDKAE